MNIRPARESDIEAIIPLIKEFHDEHLGMFGLGWDEESARKAIHMFQSHHINLIIEHGDQIVGVIAGVICPYHLNFSVIVFQEAIWYVRAEYRSLKLGIKLLDMVEQYCAEKGVSRMLMLSLASGNGKVGEFLSHRGYQPLEKHFIKTIAGDRDDKC